MPALDASWHAIEPLLVGELDSTYGLDADNLERWSKFIDAVAAAEPRVLSAKGFPDGYAEQIDTLLNRVTDDVESRPYLDSPAEMRSEAARLVSLADTMARLRRVGADVERTIDLGNRLRIKAEALEDRANQEDQPDPEPDSEEHGGRGFDIAGLFRDL
jgi:hypothetical protein